MSLSKGLKIGIGIGVGLLLVLVVVPLTMCVVCTGCATSGGVATVVADSTGEALAEARQAQTRADGRVLLGASVLHQVHAGSCPASCDELVSAGRISGTARIVDAWNNDWRFECDDTSNGRVVSAGPDGAFGTADDIIITDDDL